MILHIKEEIRNILKISIWALYQRYVITMLIAKSVKNPVADLFFLLK